VNYAHMITKRGVDPAGNGRTSGRKRPRARASLGAAVVLLLAGGTLAACGSSKSKTTSASTGASGTAAKSVTIAVIDPLTGPLAPEGQAALNGAKAGAAYLNAGHSTGNVHYVIESRDSQATPTVDNALARELTQSGIRFFIGDDLTDTGFAAEQSVFNNVHALSFTSTPVIPSDSGVGTSYPGVYGDGGDNSHYVIPFVNYFKAHQVQKVAVLYANYQAVAKWGQQAATLAKQDGMTVASEAVPLTASDVTAQLRTLKGSGATALLAYALTPTLAQAVVQGLNQIGWAPDEAALEGATGPEVAQLPAAVQAHVITGPAATTFLSSTANAQPTGLAASFFQYYAPLAKEVTGKYDSQATSGAYYFDAVLLLDQGIAAAKSTDPQAVEAALDSGKPLVASRGTYTYTAKNREGPVESDFGLYLLTAAGCPTGICQTAPST
jgi:ABC-type branched-subunit amino acid transport system substrate-binding protein